MDIADLVQRLRDNPEVVTHSKGDGVVHLASPAPDMMTLCGVEYDSMVTGPLAKAKCCRLCAEAYESR